jgi:homoserine O-acetyltransferase/O-succinyltransferase
MSLAGTFRMRKGGELAAAQIAYESWGMLDADRGNAVLLFTGLSPSSHVCSSVADPAPGWWEFMVGPGRPIDTERYFVICVNSLGSCFGSTGPASVDSSTGKRYGVKFPELCIEDIAVAGHKVVAALGIERLFAVIGASMGGMSALAYAVQFPDTAERLVVISSAAKATAFALAIRSLQREIIRADPVWQQGHYGDEEPLQGMRLARKLGIISYRSAEELQQRFGHLPIGGGVNRDTAFGMAYEVEAYLDYNARRFAGGFDANCYLYLSRAMDLFDLSEHGGCSTAALSGTGLGSALVIGVTTDVLFPLFQQQDLAEGLRMAGCQVEFSTLNSVHGHDSFLIDHERFAPVVAGFFRKS